MVHRHYAGGLVVGLSLLLVLAIYAVVLPSEHPAHAQNTDLGLEISKTLDNGSVVQVGELLNFTIRIENTGTISITDLVVVDEFTTDIVDAAQVGRFAEPDDPPLSDPPGTFDGTNRIVWDNLLDSLPNQALDAGQSLEIIVRLRAIRPTEQLQLVNRARVEEAIRFDNEDVSGAEDSAEAEAVGGANAPVVKELNAPQPIIAGDTITFTVSVNNDGTLPVEELPLEDNYNPAILEFVRAVPPPSSVNETTGNLTWDDLLLIAGRDQLEPGEEVSVTTVYRALQSTDSSANRASVSGARDRYGNELEASRAEVPIRIINVTATPRSTTTATATGTAAGTTTATATGTAAGTTTATAHATTTTTARATAAQTATRQPGGRDEDDEDDNEDRGETSQPATSQPASTGIAGTGTTTAATAQAATAQVAATTTLTTTSSISATITPTVGATATATPQRPVTLPRTASVSYDNEIALGLSLLLLLAGLFLLWWRRSVQA